MLALLSDLRYTLRRLRQAPGFTLTAVLTLALGIGAPAAIFTLVYQVMLRPLPVTHPEQLWRVGDAVLCCHANGYTQGDQSSPNTWSFFSEEAYKLFQANTPAFRDLAAFQVGNTALGVRRAGSSASVDTRNGEYVSGNFFTTFGVSAWRGRLFADADDREAALPAAVMSFRTWREKYGADASVIGAVYLINGHPFTVVGVTPPGFFGAKLAAADLPDFWLPLASEPLLGGATTRLKNPGLGWLDLIGRVRPGTNVPVLEAQLQGELHAWLASHVPDMSAQEKLLREKQTLHVTPGSAGVSLVGQEYKGSLRLLLLAAGCVLLVACANSGNLLLTRALKDRPRAAVRLALGCPRSRLVREALVETLVLSGFGALVGIAIAYAGTRLLLHLAFAGPDSPHFVSAAPPLPVLAAMTGLAVATGVACSVGPAWAASYAKPIEALGGASRSMDPAWGAARAQKTLVAVQAAVSFALVSTAVLLGQSLRHLEHRDFGFDPNGRYLVSINSLIGSYTQEQLPPLFGSVAERLRAIPGVRAASPVLYAPMSGLSWDHDIRVAGRPEPGLQDDVSSNWTRVTPGFFETVGDRLAGGRSITEEDTAGTRPVAVVNEAFARKFFGRENPVGRHFGPAPGKNAGMYEVVGVTSDMDYFATGAWEPERPMYFLPEAQTTHFDDVDSQGREVWSHSLYNIVIWAPGDPPDLERKVKRALAEAAPDIALYDVEPYGEVIDAQFSQQRTIAGLASLFGAVALVLAVVGLYGVTAYGVARRTSEIGIRMALGASRGGVVGMVLRGALAQALAGLLLGLPLAFAAARLLAHTLYQTSDFEPFTLLLCADLLVLASLAAALLPARRAASIDPAIALRSE